MVACPFPPSGSAFKPRQCSTSRDQLCRSCVPPATLTRTQTSGLSSRVWPHVCLNTVGLLVYQWMASNPDHWLWPWSWPRLIAPQPSSWLVRLPELQQGHLSCATWLWSSKNLSRTENKSQGLRKEGHCSLYREKPHLGPAQELGYYHCWVGTVEVLKKTKSHPSCLLSFSVTSQLGGTGHIKWPGITHLLL